MSSVGRAGKNHAWTWVSLPFLAVFLYAATWPPVVILTGNTRLIIGGGQHGIRYRRVISPRWVEVFYSPLSRLRDSKGGQTPFGQYWDWWARTLP